MLLKIKSKLLTKRYKAINEWFCFKNKHSLQSSWSIEDDKIFQKYREHIDINKHVEYSVRLDKLPKIKVTHKWVGAQYIQNKVYAIPNDMESFLCYDSSNKQIEFLGKFGDGLFKWTGGCIWDNGIYAFPRSSNKMIYFDYMKESISHFECSLPYKKEHHYGGVCTDNGIVYQPPRNTDHIIAWNLKNKETKRIQLTPSWLKMKFRYCGSIIHPNGFAYFLPETNGKVIKLNLLTEEWCLIGEKISPMVFDVKISSDGNIYGYSAYGNGILKITVDSDRVEMIHKDIIPGAYGTKMGINGRLYSVPGDGQYIWEYNPYTDKVKVLYDTKILTKAKCAGGITTYDGKIITVPAAGEDIYIITPNKLNCNIEKELYEKFFVDNY